MKKKQNLLNHRYVARCDFLFFSWQIYFFQCLCHIFEYILAEGYVKTCFHFNSLRIIDCDFGMKNIFFFRCCSLPLKFHIQFKNTPHTCFGQTSFKTTMRCRLVRQRLFFVNKREREPIFDCIWLYRVSKFIFVSWKHARMKFFNFNLINIKCIYQIEGKKIINSLTFTPIKLWLSVQTCTMPLFIFLSSLLFGTIKLSCFSQKTIHILSKHEMYISRCYLDRFLKVIKKHWGTIRA